MNDEYERLANMVIEFLINDTPAQRFTIDRIVSPEIANLIGRDGLTEVSTVEYGTRYTWRKIQ